MSDYDNILNMTDEQAADIIEDLFFRGQLVGGRHNGKTITQLAYHTAIVKAINKLRGKTSTPKEFLDKHTHCIRCGKLLKNPVAQERGYGEICWKKHLNDNQQTLF